MPEYIFLMLFCACAFLLLHTYVLYPVSIFVIARLRKRTYTQDTANLPKVSVLISAYNEAKVIGATVENLLQSNYPAEKLEILVGSDNSTDGTTAIMEELAGKNPAVKFYPFSTRRGKASIINDLMQQATGSVIIFADANTMYMPDALRALVKYYADSRVGGVSGKLRLLHLPEARRSGSHEDSYWNLETLLKEKEGDLGCLIGSNGGIYSIRRELFVPIPTDAPVMDDFYISMKVLEQRRHFLYIKEAAAEEYVAPTSGIEFQRKIRNNSISLLTLRHLTKLLRPSAGLAAYGFISHKLLRWYSPLFVLGVLIASGFLAAGSVMFTVFFGLQVSFYLLALAGAGLQRFGRTLPLVSLAYYFVLTNIAMLIGIYRYASGRQTAFWQSTKR